MTGRGPNGAAALIHRWRQAEMEQKTARGFRTKLSHAGRAGKRIHGFVNPPLLRGSTVLYPTVAERKALAIPRSAMLRCAAVTAWSSPAPTSC